MSELSLSGAALKGSDHLDFILDHRLIRPVSNPALEDLYRKLAPKLEHSYTFVTASEVLEGTDPEERMILPAESHSVVAKTLEVPELSGELERAVGQVQKAIEKEKLEKEKLAKEKVNEKMKEKTEQN